VKKFPCFIPEQALTAFFFCSTFVWIESAEHGSAFIRIVRITALRGENYGSGQQKLAYHQRNPEIFLLLRGRNQDEDPFREWKGQKCSRM
jgi:hypothetical protein